MSRIVDVSGSSILRYLLLAAFVFPQCTHAARFSVVYDFTGGLGGADPYNRVVAGGAGGFYGTTMSGGRGCRKTPACGVIFWLAKDGAETVLYAFSGKNQIQERRRWHNS